MTSNVPKLQVANRKEVVVGEVKTAARQILATVLLLYLIYTNMKHHLRLT
jgi:hypothetical protein